ncbi:MAG: metallophosphoesterase [Bacteroidaceae bacterium]|nr:metallophosphoesterase [Bacteroidaceae bacterium]
MGNKRLILCAVLAVCLTWARAQSWVTVGPYLQELTTDGVTVVFEHDIPSISWLEVREKGSTEVKEFYQTVNGRVKAYSQILGMKNPAVPVQNFAIRAEGLKPATTYEYRVRAHKVVSENSNGVSANTAFSSIYNGTWYQFTTQDPQQKEHHIFITSDMHNRPDTLEALLKYLDYQTCDRIIYNGDMINYMQNGSQEPYTGFINTSVNLFARNKPFEYLRGNHETRGDMSRHIMDYFPRKSGQLYNAYRWGDMEIILLDCGEDKIDTAEEYFGMASFFSYREEMARWFQELIRTDEFRTAKYRIIICHFTMLLNNDKPTDKFGGEPHLITLLTPLLKQCDIDMLISGHYHPDTYTYMDKNYNNKGNQFEEYNIGNHSAMRIDIADGKFNLKIVSSKGVVLLDKQVKDAKSGRKLVYITTKMED